jgi:hypothetical protein
MKKYLMTWYGMTDFRASLGLEQTTGPVLGALLADDYTDVIILGFTHPDKSEHKADEFQQKTAESLLNCSQTQLRHTTTLLNGLKSIFWMPVKRSMYIFTPLN